MVSACVRALFLYPSLSREDKESESNPSRKLDGSQSLLFHYFARTSVRKKSEKTAPHFVRLDLRDRQFFSVKDMSTGQETKKGVRFSPNSLNLHSLLTCFVGMTVERY